MNRCTHTGHLAVINDNDDDEKEEEYCIIFGHQDRHRGLAGEHEEPLGPTAGKSDRQNVYRLTFN